MTSREILATFELVPTASEALGGLIGATELCLFRGEQPTEADYLRCRDQFNVFAQAYLVGARQ